MSKAKNTPVYTMKPDPALVTPEGFPVINGPLTLDRARAERHPHGFEEHTGGELGLSGDDLAHLRAQDALTPTPGAAPAGVARGGVA